jgi:polysaccharide transporter, PST family
MKELINFAWLGFDKIVRGGSTLAIIVYIAQHLGPQDFGTLSYLLVLNGLLVNFATLGMGPLLTHLLVRSKSQRIVLGSAIAVTIISTIVTIVIINIGAQVLVFETHKEAVLLSILSLVHVFGVTGVLRSWFESQLASKLNIMADNCALFVGCILRILCVRLELPFEYFVYVVIAESVVTSAVLCVIFSKNINFSLNLKVNKRYMRALWGRAWPLTVSGLAVTGYMKIDQIMIGSMMSSADLGVYTAAVRFTEMWYFIPLAISISLAPRLINAQLISDIKLQEANQFMHDVTAVICALIVVPIWLCADILINVTFGVEYSGAVEVLKIYILCSIFVFYGVVSGRWLIAQKLEKVILSRTLIGLVINLGLNLILIPKYGSTGAAYSTLLSQIFVNIICDIFDPRLHPLLYAKLKALNIIRSSRAVGDFVIKELLLTRAKR